LCDSGCARLQLLDKDMDTWSTVDDVRRPEVDSTYRPPSAVARGRAASAAGAA
jgi:hypothetical protein